MRIEDVWIGDAIETSNGFLMLTTMVNIPLSHHPMQACVTPRMLRTLLFSSKFSKPFAHSLPPSEI
jgi:hypothetical protein